MAGAHIAAIILALSAPVVAQEPQSMVLSVDVTDQIGAVIPGAGIRATNQSNGERYDIAADARGHADLKVPPATYNLRVQAPGWTPWNEQSIKVSQPVHVSATLILGEEECGCHLGYPPDILLERQEISADIATISPELIPLSAKPFHRNWWPRRR